MILAVIDNVHRSGSSGNLVRGRTVYAQGAVGSQTIDCAGIDTHRSSADEIYGSSAAIVGGDGRNTLDGGICAFLKNAPGDGFIGGVIGRDGGGQGKGLAHHAGVGGLIEADSGGENHLGDHRADSGRFRSAVIVMFIVAGHFDLDPFANVVGRQGVGCCSGICDIFIRAVLGGAAHPLVADHGVSRGGGGAQDGVHLKIGGRINGNACHLVVLPHAVGGDGHVARHVGDGNTAAPIIVGISRVVVAHHGNSNGLGQGIAGVGGQRAGIGAAVVDLLCIGRPVQAGHAGIAHRIAIQSSGGSDADAGAQAVGAKAQHTIAVGQCAGIIFTLCTIVIEDFHSDTGCAGG